MSYINPFELLNFTTDNLYAVDDNAISKAKRKLLAEIELSENTSIKFKKIELSKSDFFSIIDEVDNDLKKEFHLFIFNNKPLNNFLSSGDLTFFTQFKSESIYNDEEFLEFISPYFSFQYDNVLFKSFKKAKLNNFRNILSIQPITNSRFIDKCYISLYSYIREIDNEIIKIANTIDKPQIHFLNDGFDSFTDIVLNKVYVPYLNYLPTYFQSIKNQVALSLYRLARDVNNNPHNLYAQAFKIIEVANSITTDGFSKQTVTNGYNIIKNNYENDIPILKNVTQKRPTDSKPNPIPIETNNEVAQNNSIIKKNRKILLRYLISGFCGLIFCVFIDFNIQLLIFSFSISILVFRFYNIILHPKTSIRNNSKELLFFLLSFVICTTGYFYPPLTLVYVLYHILRAGHIFLYQVFSDNPYIDNKRFGILMISIIITIFINPYVISPKRSIIKNSLIQPNNKSNNTGKDRNVKYNSSYNNSISSYNDTNIINASELNFEMRNLNKNEDKFSVLDSSSKQKLQNIKNGFPLKQKNKIENQQTGEVKF
jgi:hypothetical protein